MDVENFDISKAPHSDKLRPTSFWLRTRKGYTERFANNITGNPNFGKSMFIGGDVTDIAKIEQDIYDSFGCKTWEKETVILYMWISDDKRVKKVFDEFECNVWTEIYSGSHTPEGSDKFFEIDFVKGQRRTLTTNPLILWQWIQTNKNSSVVITNNITQKTSESTTQNWLINESSFQYIDTAGDFIKIQTIQNPTEWEFSEAVFENNSNTRNRDAGCGSILPWDYLYVYDYNNQYSQWNGIAWDWSIWAVNIIGWITQDKKTLLMQTGRDGFFPGQKEWWNLKYEIYPDYWPVVWRSTIDWIAIKHRDIDITYRKLSKSPSNILSHNGQVAIYYRETGWLQFGWVWTQQLYFTGITDVGVWRKSFASFRQFLVWFGETNINATLFNFDAGRPWSITQKVIDNRTIFSKDSRDISENSLYIVADNKKIYSVDIKFESTTNQFYMELKDSSAPIKWDLALIEPTDNVSLKDNFNELRIFINGDQWFPRDNGVHNKTKMIIYNKDYGVWHRHTTTNSVIKWVKFWIFYWSDVYDYCWHRDSILWLRSVWIETNGAQIITKINFFMGESETNNQWLVPYNYKKLNYIKIMVWLYTKLDKSNNEDGQIFIYSEKEWTRPIRTLNGLNKMRYIENITEVKNWGVMPISDCLIQQQIDCTNFFDKCDGWPSIPLVSNWCNCPTEQKEVDDYWFCFEDKLFQFGKYAQVYIPLPNFHNANTYKIELKTTGIIELYWFAVGYMLDNAKNHLEASGNNRTCDSCSPSFQNPTGSCWC